MQQWILEKRFIKASDFKGWLRRFLSLVLRARTSMAPSRRLNSVYEMRLNCEHAPVFFLRRELTPKVRSEKQRITACTSSGKMLPPMVIFKGKTQRVIKDISNSHGAVVSFQKEAEINVSMYGSSILRKAAYSRLLHRTSDHACTVYWLFQVGVHSVLQPLDVSSQ